MTTIPITGNDDRIIDIFNQLAEYSSYIMDSYNITENVYISKWDSTTLGDYFDDFE